MLAFILPFLKSRAGMLVMLSLALFSWHKIDKSSAVRKAVVAYVADVELSAQRRSLEIADIRIAALKKANGKLALDIGELTRDAQANTERASALINGYSPIEGCVVGSNLIGLLRQP